MSRDQPAPAGTSNILKQICPFCIIPHIFSCSIARLVLFFKPSTYLFHHFLFFFLKSRQRPFHYTWIFVLQLFFREPVLGKQKQLKDIYLVCFLEILITWQFFRLEHLIYLVFFFFWENVINLVVGKNKMLSTLQFVVGKNEMLRKMSFTWQLGKNKMLFTRQLLKIKFYLFGLLGKRIVI